MHSIWAAVEVHPEEGDLINLSSMKPGWARINLHWTMTNEELDYVWQAITFIEQYGYLFLTQYYLALNGSWNHQNTFEKGG